LCCLVVTHIYLNQRGFSTYFTFQIHSIADLGEKGPDYQPEPRQAGWFEKMASRYGCRIQGAYKLP